MRKSRALWSIYSCIEDVLKKKKKKFHSWRQGREGQPEGALHSCYTVTVTLQTFIVNRPRSIASPSLSADPDPTVVVSQIVSTLTLPTPWPRLFVRLLLLLWPRVSRCRQKHFGGGFVGVVEYLKQLQSRLARWWLYYCYWDFQAASKVYIQTAFWGRRLRFGFLVNFQFSSSSFLLFFSHTRTKTQGLKRPKYVRLLLKHTIVNPTSVPAIQ